MEIPITEPEKINFQEMMDYYGYRDGYIGRKKLQLRMFKSWFLHYLAQRVPTSDMTVKLHRMRGVNIGEHVYIGPYTEIDLLYPHLITIEDYVSIGMHTMIFAHSNPTNSYLIKAQLYPRMVKPVVIKRGVWIPPGCIILPGVTIGEHSIIGAGSLVNKDIPPKTLAIGSPAKPVKNLDIEEPDVEKHTYL
ncbi:MAG: acyltransferase [candidate division WOR-3 bacterium]|nr:MAG: acyltransferase [candidate division WOR-3 bacterium]